MGFPDNATGQGEHRSYDLITLCILCCVAALSAGLLVLPELQVKGGSASTLLHPPVEPAAMADIPPSAVISPDENLSATDRELLAFKPHGG